MAPRGVPDGHRSDRELAPAPNCPDSGQRLKWAFVVAVVTAAAAAVRAGAWSPLVAFGLFLALWIVATTVAAVRTPAQARRSRALRQARRQSGRVVRHAAGALGIAVFIVGVTLVKGYDIEETCRSTSGQTVTVGGDEFTFRGVTPVTGPNYRGAGRHDRSAPRRQARARAAAGKARLQRVRHDDDRSRDQHRLLGDLYVSLGEPVTDKGEAGAWGVRIYVKPFVDWIWGGCFLMALGGFIAMSDRRYRSPCTREVRRAGRRGARQR